MECLQHFVRGQHRLRVLDRRRLESSAQLFARITGACQCRRAYGSGKLCLGLNADFDRVADLALFREQVAESFAEWCEKRSAIAPASAWCAPASRSPDGDAIVRPAIDRR